MRLCIDLGLIAIAVHRLTSSSGAAQPAVPDNLQQSLENISRTLAQLTAGTSPSMPNGVSPSPNTGKLNLYISDSPAYNTTF